MDEVKFYLKRSSANEEQTKKIAECLKYLDSVGIDIDDILEANFDGAMPKVDGWHRWYCNINENDDYIGTEFPCNDDGPEYDLIRINTKVPIHIVVEKYEGEQTEIDYGVVKKTITLTDCVPGDYIRCVFA